MPAAVPADMHSVTAKQLSRLNMLGLSRYQTGKLVNQIERVLRQEQQASSWWQAQTGNCSSSTCAGEEQSSYLQILFRTCKSSGVRRKWSFKHASEVLGHLEPGFSARRPKSRASTLPFKAHKEAPKPLDKRFTSKFRNPQVASNLTDAQTAQPRARY